MDQGSLGDVSEQPSCQILRALKERTATTRGREGRMDKTDGRSGPGIGDDLGGVKEAGFRRGPAGAKARPYVGLLRHD